MGKPVTSRFRKAYCRGENHFQIDTLATGLNATSYFLQAFLFQLEPASRKWKRHCKQTEMTNVEGKISRFRKVEIFIRKLNDSMYLMSITTFELGLLFLDPNVTMFAKVEISVCYEL